MTRTIELTAAAVIAYCLGTCDTDERGALVAVSRLTMRIRLP